MTQQLREELDALARTQTFSPDPAAWARGRRARRRARLAQGAAAVAVVAVAAGSTLLVARPDAVGPAGDPVRDGAIPSRIPEATGQPVTDLAIGRASVAYVEPDTQAPVLVDASTGEAHRVDLPDFPEIGTERTESWFTGQWLALSPDGRRLAYPVTTLSGEGDRIGIYTAWYRVVDLETGATSLVDMPPRTGTPRAVSWTSDGRIAIDVHGRVTRPGQVPPIEARTIDPATSESRVSPLTGALAPGERISATNPLDDAAVRSVPFETARGERLRRLPADLYPSGAEVTPVGWADDSLLVAQVDAPAGSYVEGRHLVLMTSPDRPESEWTYRILLRDVPDTSTLSVAVDLLPDLDGTSSQVLTRDFGEAAASGEGPDRVPYVLGALMALLAGLAFIRMLRHQA